LYDSTITASLAGITGFIAVVDLMAHYTKILFRYFSIVDDAWF